MSPPLPSALERWDEIATRLRGAPFGVFLDFDGTLSPIVSRPEDAVLPPARREQLRRLAAVTFVAIVTGRAMADIRARVGLPTLHYASDHGFQIAGPSVAFEVDPDLHGLFQQAAVALGERLRDTPGVVLEPKRYSVAVHYRLADPSIVPRIEAVVDEVVARHEGLRKGLGRAVFELRPSRPWHKGAAVEWLWDRCGIASSAYIGDDRTDEDALSTVRQRRGIGIIVGTPSWPTAATYRVADPDEVGTMLDALTSLA